jgi:peptidoglycan hydrolase-like protein with peptidoglycan-binding domain
MECGFMNSTVDVPIILSDSFATAMAKALARVIVERSGAKKVTTGSLGSVRVEMPVLCSGSKGEAVKTLQRLLNAHGYTDSKGKPLAVDGSFGPATLYALKKYQYDENLTVDGKCGQYTWNSLLIY